MDDVVIARALHVLAIVIWIGGVAMMTMVVLPALRRGDLGPNRLQVFEAVERRFTWHARSAAVIVGVTGFYMTDRLDLWGRFRLGRVLVDARHGVSVADIHARPFRCRAALFTPMVPCQGKSGAGYRVCAAAAGSLAPACTQPYHHPRCRRRQPGNVPALTGVNAAGRSGLAGRAERRSSGIDATVGERAHDD